MYIRIIMQRFAAINGYCFFFTYIDLSPWHTCLDKLELPLRNLQQVGVNLDNCLRYGKTKLNTDLLTIIF